MDETKMVGIRIKNRRNELHLTQKDVYNSTGISTGNLSEIERGNVLPSSKALVSLSKLLQTSIDWILTGEYSKLDNSLKSDTDDSKNEYQLHLSESEELIIYMMRDLSIENQNEVKNFIRSKLATSAKLGLSSVSTSGKESTEDASVSA